MYLCVRGNAKDSEMSILMLVRELQSMSGVCVHGCMHPYDLQKCFSADETVQVC